MNTQVLAGKVVSKRIVAISQKPLAGGLCNQCCEFVIAHRARKLQCVDHAERSVGVHTVAHRCRRCLHVLKHRVRQAIGQRCECHTPARCVRMAADGDLGVELEQPAPAIGTLPVRTTVAVKVGRFAACLAFIKLPVEPRYDRPRMGGFGIEIQEPRQRPVHVHAGMPVVAAVKDRMQRRGHTALRFGRRMHKVHDEIRILAAHVVERGAGVAGVGGIDVRHKPKSSFSFL